MTIQTPLKNINSYVAIHESHSFMTVILSSAAEFVPRMNRPVKSTLISWSAQKPYDMVQKATDGKELYFSISPLDSQ